MYVEFIEQNLTTSLHQTVIQRLLNLYNESKSITSERREPWIFQTIRKFLPALNWIISLLSISWLLLEESFHVHSYFLFFRLNIPTPSKDHHRARFHVSYPLTTFWGIVWPVQMEQSHHSSVLEAMAFRIPSVCRHSHYFNNHWTLSAHVELLAGFNGNRLALEQRHLGSKPSFTMYRPIVVVFHISLFSMDTVITTYCCSLIHYM